MNEFKDQRDNLWKQVGNLLHDTVALGDDEVLNYTFHFYYLILVTLKQLVYNLKVILQRN